MKCETGDVYVSCSCNRTPHSSDWGKNGLICFGACNSVAVYDPKYAGAGKILKTLCHHKGRVNSVQWIKASDFSVETEVISASSDWTAAVWSSKNLHDFNVSSVLQGHGNTVTYAHGMYLESGKDNETLPLIILTASVDSTLKIWIRKQENVLCTQTIKLGSGFCLCAQFFFLPGSKDILIAVATDDAKIHLFGCEKPTDLDKSVKESFQGTNFVKLDSLIGHEDWVRGLDITMEDSGDLLLASCSQDSFVRLWRIYQCKDEMKVHIPVSELSPSEDIRAEEHLFKIGGNWYAWSLESVLAGHEGWVYGVDWHPVVILGNRRHQPLRLLSSSIDKTMVVWSFDSESGLWTEAMRVGELGGNSLGFYGGKFGPQGGSIMGHGYQGAFHFWYLSETGEENWQPGVVVGGHFGPVVDLQWEPKGQFLLTVSTDQTTRIHAPWVRDKSEITWHELARPQIHGYDMSCLAVLSRYRFASGSEEKVIRAFKAPSNFITNFKHICQVEEDIEKLIEECPKGAAVPTLGLSNKAVFGGQLVQPENRHVKDEFPESSYFVPIELQEPPTEDNLLQNTLWPEVQKLYGHGYELYSLAARSDGKVLASACKATVPEHAAIILWDTDSWQQIQKLVSHHLTVTQLAFSPDGTLLLSVSRDRRWSLFQQESSGNQYGHVSDKKSGVHTRIIWCCAWTHDSLFFATGSRDGKIGIWNRVGEISSEPLEFKGESVTALTFAPYACTESNNYILALGLESGVIKLCKWNTSSWQQCQTLNSNFAHHLAVRRLSFRPVSKESGEPLQLASCGNDHIVRIQLVNLD